MTNKLILSDEEEHRVSYLQTLLSSLPQDTDPSFDIFTPTEQDFLVSAREHFDIWQELSLNQEEWLVDLWKKWRERKKEEPQDER